MTEQGSYCYSGYGTK